MIDIQLLADKKGIAREYLDATNKLVKFQMRAEKCSRNFRLPCRR